MNLFEALSHDEKSGPVHCFGSSQFMQDHRYYQLARTVGQYLGQAGFTVMTGGDPGIMEATNRGAQDVDALSVGCNIMLPQEQAPNPYLDINTQFNHFFVRKVMLLKFSSAFVILPGGFVTLDEIFETLNLIESEKIQNFPLVVMGKDYWATMEDFIHTSMIDEKTISVIDTGRLFMTDDPQAMIDYIHTQIPIAIEKIMY